MRHTSACEVCLMIWIVHNQLHQVNYSFISLIVAKEMRQRPGISSRPHIPERCPSTARVFTPLLLRVFSGPSERRRYTHRQDRHGRDGLQSVWCECQLRDARKPGSAGENTGGVVFRLSRSSEFRVFTPPSFPPPRIPASSSFSLLVTVESETNGAPLLFLALPLLFLQTSLYSTRELKDLLIY